LKRGKRQRVDKAETAGSTFSNSFDRGMRVLAAFVGAEPWLSGAELAQRCALPRTTVLRLAATLLASGYLQRDARGKFGLTVRMLTFAHPVLTHLPIREVARPLMREFARLTDGNVSMCARDGDRLVYVEISRSIDGFAHAPEIGFSIDMAYTSPGRALLSMLPAGERDACLARFARQSPQVWRRIRASVLKAINECRSKGFCVSAPGDWRPEISGAGLPLGRMAGGELLALGLGLPSFRTSSKALHEDLGPRLLSLGRSLIAAAGPSGSAASPTPLFHGAIPEP